MGLLDAAYERRQADFAGWVDAVRVGTATAWDKKAADRWREHQAGPKRGLAGAELERVLMDLARSHPDLVAIEVA